MFVTSKKTPSLFSNRNVLFFLASVTLFLGVILANAWALAIGLIYVVILILAYWDAQDALVGLTVDRTHHSRTFEKSRVDVTLRLAIDRPRPIYLLRIQDTFPPAAQEKIGHLVRDAFSAHSNYEIYYSRPCVRRRGEYTLGPVTAQMADPMGLFPQSTTLPVFSNLVVYPLARSLPALSVLGQGTLFHVGRETTRRSGQSEEFIGLREYRPGDTPLHIHWPSSARHERFIVKEFQETVVTEVILVLDLTRLSLTGLGDQTSAELVIQAGAATAARAIEQSHRVEVFTIANTVDHIPLGGGGEHLTTILDRMALYRSGGDTPFPNALEHIAPLIRRGATLVAVFGAATSNLEQMEQIARRLTLEKVRCIFIPVDERQFMKLSKEQEEIFFQAESFDTIIERLTLAGADVAPLQVGVEGRELTSAFGAQSV